MAQPRRLICSIFTAVGFLGSLYLMVFAGMYFAEDHILFPSEFKPLKGRRVEFAFHVLNSTIEEMKKHAMSLSVIMESQSLSYEKDLEIFISFWSEIEEETSNVKKYQDDSSCHFLFKNPCPDNFRELIEICENFKMNKIVLKMYNDYKNSTYDTIQAQTGPFIFHIELLQETLEEIKQIYITIRKKCNYEQVCIKTIELVISDSLKDFTNRVSDYDNALKKIAEAVLEHEETIVYKVQNIKKMDFEDVENVYLACLREFNEEGIKKIQNIIYRRVKTVETMEAIIMYSHNLLKNIVPLNLNVTPRVPDIKET